VKYWETNTAADAREMAIEDMLLEIELYLRPLIEFLESSNAAEIKTAFQVPFGSGGPPEYYYRLCKMVKTKFSDFQPEGMEEWEEEQSEEKIQEADLRLKNIVSEMRRYIFDVFRTIYGEDLYWERGITDKAIKTAAYEISLDTDVGERLPPETYLEVVQMKKIVETRNNWPLFKEVFNIPELGEKGLAKNLKWMERINELRRIPAHPARERKYKVEDFQYIDFIHDALMKRIKEAQANPVLEAPPLTGAEDA
jgi:DNA sulfur modification protein DndB